MQIDEKTYQEADLTIWASYETESAVALAAKAIARERGWPVDRVCRIMVFVFLAGGRSGKPRDEDVFWLETRVVQNFMKHGIPIPQEIQSYTWSPIMKKICEGR